MTIPNVRYSASRQTIILLLIPGKWSDNLLDVSRYKYIYYVLDAASSRVLFNSFKLFSGISHNDIDNAVRSLTLGHVFWGLLCNVFGVVTKSKSGRNV